MTPLGTSTPEDPQWRFDPKESSGGQYLFYLDRAPAGVAIDGAARLMRAPLAGGHEELVSSVFGRFCGRSRTRRSSSSVASRTSTRLMSTGPAIGRLPE